MNKVCGRNYASSAYCTGSVPLCSINEMLHNTVPMVIQITAYLTKTCVGLHPIRHLQLISNTLGAYNSMIVNGNWCILKQMPVRPGYK